jgi:uncharacterized tellurite resistance protein B-like protein
MSIIEFKSIRKFFGNSVPSPEEKQALFQEVMIMTLARATSSDTNIEPVEVETVQALLREEAGADISETDIRLAAASALFENTPLEKYLAKAGSKLDTGDRVRVVQALAKVIKSDVRVSNMEANFFNMVATALNVRPAELAGLIPSG